MKQLWKDSLDLRDNLRRRMPELTAEYFADGRQALAPGVAWEEMHAFRLRTKRYRYTLETFRDVYGPALDARIECLKKLQTHLGNINDLVVTSAMLSEADGMESIRESLSKQMDKEAAKLREYWQEKFDPPEVERRWTTYLINYACRPPVIPRTRRLPPKEQ